MGWGILNNKLKYTRIPIPQNVLRKTKYFDQKLADYDLDQAVKTLVVAMVLIPNDHWDEFAHDYLKMIDIIVQSHLCGYRFVHNSNKYPNPYTQKSEFAQRLFQASNSLQNQHLRTVQSRAFGCKNCALLIYLAWGV